MLSPNDSLIKNEHEHIFIKKEEEVEEHYEVSTNQEALLRKESNSVENYKVS